MDTIPHPLPAGQSVTDLYQAAIGQRNQNYYVTKFEDFDQHGEGMKVSWNWAAFLLTGVWALYRRMYGWFVLWWVVATILVIFEKSQNAQIHQALAVVVGGLWLGFGAFANTLYHRKVRAQIAVARKANADATRVTKRLLVGGGVHAWVPYAFGGVPVIGIVAAVALPAYQDYAKRAGNVSTVVISQPDKTPAQNLDLSEFKPASVQPPKSSPTADANTLDQGQINANKAEFVIPNRVAGLVIGDANYSDVVGLLGTPTLAQNQETAATQQEILNLYYPVEGIEFTLDRNRQMKVVRIEIYRPFLGKSQEGLYVGMSFNEARAILKSRYGQPKMEFDGFVGWDIPGSSFSIKHEGGQVVAFKMLGR